ncbi:phage baseplate assembly protein V [Modicisalibacter muralis]|uniref:Phage baseplate assembly protein V n=1 Tax=Modicisalibacter muralis TaxID=119000 RepID=A0A1G9EQZ1_9GAMM|nr:phage baseplate assembly protein V [Halomonas muralis]SDK78483.1 phage baseplate assembly protein V [Halomonas muralis]
MNERMLGAAELLRLIHNLVRIGTIAEVDHDAARVRVKSGELLTDWLQWLTLRAGTTRDWDPPTVGEQVILLSPGGDPAGGIAITGLFSAAHPAPAASADLWRRLFPDEGLFEYDHAAKVLRIKLPGRIEIEAPGGTSWLGDIGHQGDMTRQGSYAQDGGTLTHNDKNVGYDHPHSGVVPGGGNSGGPV